VGGAAGGPARGAAGGVAGVTVDGTAGVAAGAVGAVVRVAGGQISGCSSCPSSSIDGGAAPRGRALQVKTADVIAMSGPVCRV